MRRLILEEPVSAAAVWSRRLALFSLALGLVAVILLRARATDVVSGVAVLGFAILGGCVAVLLAGAAFAAIWRTGRRGVGIAVGGAFIALVVLAWPGWLAAQAVRLPLLADISTDLVDPPAFSRSLRATSARNGHLPPDVPAERRAAQRRAYPAVQPIVIDLDPDEAYQMVLKAAQALGWRVVDQSPPGGRRGVGRVDAVDSTLLMRLPEDVTVRLRPLVAQTRIDVRSASRYGRHDFGGNAARIQRFASEMQALLDAR